LHHVLEQKYHGVAWPSTRLPAEPDALMEAVIARVNRSSALWQQFGVMCDVIVADEEGARYYEELPVDYVREQGVEDAASFFTVTLEYGPDHDLIDPFDISIGRIAQADAERAHQGRYLHPVVRHYADGSPAAEHHVTENLENDWTSPEVHRGPLRAFFAREVSQGAPIVAV
jgi:hypothetical protein